MANDSTQFIKNIQELICLLDNDFDNFASVLDQIVAEVVKNPKHTAVYVTFINTQLSNAATRKKGLVLLRFFLPFCTNEILEEEAAAWLNNSIKNCKKESTIQDEAYKVIKPLLVICNGSPDLNRSITSGTLNKIIENITKIHYNSENSIHALKCLETCLRIYSGSCLPFKTSIENFILTFIDCSTSANVVRLAGRCFHALQQIGGGGTKGINHKLAWKNQQLNLCATVHSLMDELFESVMELGHVQQDNVAPILLPKLPIGDKNKLTFYRVINLITFLQEMLLGAFPVAKSVYPNVILNLVTRGLSITRATLGDQIISDAINMSSNLYFIHKHLLQLLQALVVSLGCDLIPYATPICKLIINNLKLTKPKDAGNVKAFCELRIVAYQTLSLWITTAKAASCINTFSDSFVPAIMNDITPYTAELNLSVKNSSTPKHLSKKAKKKMQHEQIMQSGVAKNYAPFNKKSIFLSNVYQNKICLEAINILQTILINCGYLLKPVTHKQLQELVVKTLFSIQRGYTPVPYDDIKCKVGLYKTLTTLVTNHHWNMTPPIQYAVQLLSRGQNDDNPDIAIICSTAVSNLNSFIHPPSATLQFPLDLDNLRYELNLDQEKNAPSPVLEIVESDQEIEMMDTTDENNKIVEQEIPIPDVEKSPSNINENIINKCSEVETDKLEENVNNELNTSCDIKSQETIIIKGDKNKDDQIVLSDDEVMEHLVIDDEPEIISNVIKINDESEKENVTKTEESSTKKNEEVIDLVEEDMISAFVDVINE